MAQKDSLADDTPPPSNESPRRRRSRAARPEDAEPEPVVVGSIPPKLLIAAPIDDDGEAAPRRRRRARAAAGDDVEEDEDAGAEINGDAAGDDDDESDDDDYDDEDADDGDEHGAAEDDDDGYADDDAADAARTGRGGAAAAGRGGRGAGGRKLRAVDGGGAKDEPPRAAAKRARRRPRAEHVSTPPMPAAAPKKSKRTSKARPKAKPAAKLTMADRLAHLPMEITGIVVFALGVLVLLSLLSYSAHDTAAGRVGHVHNWIGPGGAVLANLLTLLLGLGAFGVPLLFFGAGALCFRPLRQPRHAALRAGGAVVALLSTMMILHLLFRSSTSLPFPAGGVVGGVVADAMSRVIAPLGTGVLAAALAFTGVLVALDRPLGPTTRNLGERFLALVAAGRERLEVWREERRLLLEEEDRLRAEIEAPDPEGRAEERKQRVKEAAEQRAKKRLREISVAPVGPSAPPAEVSAPPTIVDAAPVVAADVTAPPADGGLEAQVVASDPPWALEAFDEPAVDGKVVSLQRVLGDPRAGAGKLAPPQDGDDDGALRIIERLQVDPKAFEVVDAVQAPKQAFQLPPLNLLDYDAPPPVPLDEGKMRAQADKLIAKFRDFGIEGRIREIRPGPVCTTYELVPAPGIKVSKIAALADDIAMAMEAIHVRIVAPIPGKGAVGIEIPNEKRETVYMKEIIADPAFGKKPDKLMMALGKDIEGRSYYANLAEMPHVLISGTTGSGKSVSVNAMICSILYRATPDDVRFLMVDPKMLELSIYEGIPHLLLPPIIDSKKAALALKWAVGEMERRYQLMSELGVRDLAGFNQRVLDAKEGRDPEARDTLTRCLEGKPLEKLPFIVIVVDEYADLLAVAGKDVESYVMRLAQKARAAGLHVMLATQRPSVDVITGVIKANFPVRMGFRLASSHDSKTIINRPGAEKLLGRGDMLFMPPGTSNVLRVHGAFISEKELHRVVEHLKGQGKPDYDMSILTVGADDEGGDGGGAVDEPKDARFDEAVAVVARTRKCSTSWLQRMMNLGYQRAARIVDRMERDGLVGPAQNAKGDREIYVKPD